MTNTNIVTDGLDAERIAALVRESNPVCLLPWRNEGNAARDDCTLYVYQTHGMDAGRYLHPKETWDESRNPVKEIKYTFPISREAVASLGENQASVETVCLLSNRKPDAKVRGDVDLEDYYRIKDSKKNQN